jgi:hypothetical protein
MSQTQVPSSIPTIALQCPAPGTANQSVSRDPMSSKTEKPTQVPEAELGSLAPKSGQRRSTGRREPPAASRTEAQLRARVAELEAQLTDVARCLEAAENRAAELLAVHDALREAERKLAVIKATRSWRFTAPVRTVGQRVRRLSGR